MGEIGGHFGANLGTCEIAVALHSLIDSPRDKMLWDVGHQAYPHKVLTGRRDQLDTIRQYGGLAPFCSIPESEHDIMGAGHASTSIGYAVGLKEAMRQGQGEDGKVVAVIGDGAMTGGVAFEAVHQAGGLGTPIVVILNDNGMSISPNVGALSRYFNRMRLDPGCGRRARASRRSSPSSRRGIGAAFERLGPQLKESVKALWPPGLWWEELDWAYIGVIDGHDVRALRRALQGRLRGRAPRRHPRRDRQGQGLRARRGRRPGGHGEVARRQAEVDRRQRPAAAKPSARPRAAPPQYTQVFGEAMVRECERDPRVIGITAAMNSGTGLSILQKALPERYFDVGIAEQQAVLFAAGMALQGMRPVAAIYSTFLQRAFDQIVHDVCLQQLPVTFCMDRAGLVGDDGPTHHGVFDIAYLRAAAEHDADGAARRGDARAHAPHGAPARRRARSRSATRAARPSGSRSRGSPSLIEIGTGEVLREGERVAIVGYGTGVGKALGAADLLAERGLDVTVADARFAKPLDAPLLARLAAEHDLLVTVEEGVLAGGFGSARLGGALRGRGPSPRILRDRAAGPLRHPRRAEAPARGGRLHRRGDRRAHRGRGARSAPLAGRRLRRVPAVTRVRLDSLLAERGLFESRSRAAAAVMAGEVHVGLAPRRASRASSWTPRPTSPSPPRRRTSRAGA